MGSGYARIVAKAEEAGWVLHCDFHDGQDEGETAASWRYPLDRAGARPDPPDVRLNPPSARRGHADA